MAIMTAPSAPVSHTMPSMPKADQACTGTPRSPAKGCTCSMRAANQARAWASGGVYRCRMMGTSAGLATACLTPRGMF